MSEPWILGVSYSHNGAACLLRGASLVVAIQEERLSGVKRAYLHHYQDSLAVNYCLAHAGISMSDLDVVVGSHFLGDSPPPARADAAAPPARRVLAIPHHLGHAYAVFATSGFDAAGVLIVDGQGSAVAHLPERELARVKRGRVPGLVKESEVISVYDADGLRVSLLEKHTGDWIPGFGQMAAPSEQRRLPQFGSLGGMYSAVSSLIFGDPMEAGKVMGLAPYGRATLPVEDFFTIDDDGCFQYADRLPAMFRDLDPWPAHRERFSDLAASTQAALEHAMIYLAQRTRALGGRPRLCVAGGVALNSVANEILSTRLGFEDVYVMPAAEDSGPAIGAAYYGLHALRGGRLQGQRVGTDSVGRPYRRAEIDAAIARVPHVEVVAGGDALDATVARLCAGEIVGWFEGGSELGPRSLGQRSLLCDPRRPDAKAVLNDRVKHRESFRPFAPAILRDEVPAWFEVAAERVDSPYMLRVCRFKEAVRELVPAVVHVDGTGRVQTVTEENGRLYQLLQRFRARTGIPILLNTSFNIAGEPIVETPEDALWCLLGAGVDAVVLEDVVVRKAAAHRSILQLYPRVRARQAQIVVALEEGRLDLSIGPHAAVSLVMETPYGALTTRQRVADLGLLRLCDGTRDGWEIIDELARSSNDAVDEARVARRLYYLRRAHVVALHREPAERAA